jgi:hypothetical protein
MTPLLLMTLLLLLGALVAAVVREVRQDRPATPPRSHHDEPEMTYLPRWI